MKNLIVIFCGLFIFMYGQSQNTTSQPSTQPSTQTKTITTQPSGKKAAGKTSKKDEYPGVKHLAIGGKLPMSDVKMQDISDKMISLDEIADENGLLIVFSCNTCPFVIAYEDRYPTIQEYAEKNNIGYVILNPNERKRQADNMDDSFENMKAHADEVGYDCYYMIDKNHALADEIGAFRTPDVFLFNANKELVYKGAIDDNWKNKDEVNNQYLTDAIDKMLKGEKIEFPDVKGRGCSIKRLEK